MSLRLLLASSLVLPAAAFAQGALTPPGAPAPSMKSLAELDASLAALTAKAEARIPISAATTPGDATATYIIASSGSYYLTGNLNGESGKHCIQINASNVTLDLNGNSLISGPAIGVAVNCSGSLRQVTICNGSIRGTWSFGINLASLSLVAVRDVSISNVTTTAISSAGVGALIERCQVTECGGGIATNTEYGIVRGCSVSFVNRSLASAIYGISGCVVSDCSVSGVSNFDADGVAYGVLARTVTNTRVSAVTAPTCALISAQVVTNCDVTNGSVTPTGSLFGISAREVSHCHVSQILANGGFPAIGIQSPCVSDCTVERVTNAGAGGAYGIRGGATSTTTGSATETASVSRCTVSGSSGTGIAAVGTAVVEGNRVGHCTGTAISVSNGTVRGNFTHGCGLGISASGGLVTGNTSQADTVAFNFGANVRAGTTVAGGALGAFDVNANIDL